MNKVSRYLLLMVELLIVVSLVKNLAGTLKAKNMIKTLRNKKERLELRRKELKARLAKVKSGDYMEYVAREELNLVKPGEKLVIVDKEMLKSAENKDKKLEPELKNWQKWRRVILGF